MYLVPLPYICLCLGSSLNRFLNFIKPFDMKNNYPITFSLIISFFFYHVPSYTQINLEVDSSARVTGNFIELVKPSDPSHVMVLSSEGAAMDINTTTDLYLNPDSDLLLGANNPNIKVGIGTAAPQNTLHIVGDRINLEDANNGGRAMHFRVDGAGLDIDAYGAEVYFNAHNL